MKEVYPEAFEGLYHIPPTSYGKVGMQAGTPSNLGTAMKVLKWAIREYYPKIAISCSFGKDSTSVVYMATRIEPKIKVFFLNTGFVFKETLEFKDKIARLWNLNLVEYKPNITPRELFNKFGSDIYKTNPALCCNLMKVEPTRKALRGLEAWITGLRKGETAFRKSIGMVEEYENIVKINPLAHWGEEAIWDFIRGNKLPYNPLYDKGFSSIGCKPCTTAGVRGQFERAGRWVGTDKEGGECGIHTFLKKKRDII